MNLYLVSRKDRVDYDEFDSFVCAAENEEQAKKINASFPDEEITYYPNRPFWVKDLSNLTVIKIGETNIINDPKIILSSYNAG